PSSPQPRIEEQVSAPPAPADATAPIEEPSIHDESRSEENSVSASETAPVTEAASETASEAPASEVEPASASDAPASETAASDEPEADPLPTFEELGLPTRLISAVRAMGWKMPTRVQVECQPPMTAGKDVLVQSHTGSGKTGAFCIPWLTARFDQRPASETGVQLLVILPTRELAKQVCDELVRLASESPVDVLPVYGGTAMRPQLSALERGVHAVVGTPGRVLDHIRRRSLKLGNVNTVVLDECDEMLSMGFLEDIRAILDACSGPHQTCLFSATIPRDIQRIAKRYMSDPVNVELSGDHVAAAEIDHGYYMVNSAVKTRDLLDILMLENPTRAIIFCNTREETKLVSSVLNREGYDAHPLSSDLTQSQREKVMGRMREHKLRFLVATDVAARGIDISHVTHVINYSFPESAEVYVHRTGRTGRAGRTGTALSLISPRELGNFYTLKLHYSTITFAERKTPPAAQLAAERTEYRLDQISQLLPEMVGPEWVALARSLMADPRGERVISFLLSRAVRSQEKARRQALALEEDPQEHPREHEYEADSEDGDGRRNRRPRRGRERDRGRERGDRSRSRDRSDRRDRDSDRNSRDDRRSRDASPETSKTDEGRKRRRRRSGREDKNVQADAEVKVAAAEDSATEAAEVSAPTEVAQTAPENATSAAGETPTEATFHFPGGLADYLTDTLGEAATYADRPFAGKVEFQ
ncbi:MAG: DEAD/DEAH box helicase, partial [Nannocystaceae bacterium]